MVSVIFRPHGRRISSNLRYFPSLSLTQTLYTVIYLTQRAKNMMGKTDVTDITAKRWLDIWSLPVPRWGNDTNMWTKCYDLTMQL